MAFTSAALSLSGVGNDWASTASKLEQALAKVGEAERAGLALEALEGFLLRIEKLATDASKIMKNMRTYRSEGLNPRDIAIEGIGKRADELMTEIDTRISAQRYLNVITQARSRRIQLHTRPALPPLEIGSSGGASTPNGSVMSARVGTPVARSARAERGGEEPPEYGA